jgi:hypothetical protein
VVERESRNAAQPDEHIPIMKKPRHRMPGLLSNRTLDWRYSPTVLSSEQRAIAMVP